jgi:hypothetical protein
MTRGGNRHTATRSYTAKRDQTEGGLYQMNDSRWELERESRPNSRIDLLLSRRHGRFEQPRKQVASR